jgi:ribosome-associated translation inhibitor RaiA
MDIRIKTTDYQMVPSTQTYLDERVASIEKLLGHDAQASRMEVEIGHMTGHKHGTVWFTEINLLQPGVKLVNARAEGENVNATIDEVKDEIINQMRKQRQVHRRVLRRGGAALKRLMQFGSGE